VQHTHLPKAVGAQVALVLAWAVVDEAAHVALEPPPAVHEAHERVDVRLTSTAAERPAIAKVHHLRGSGVRVRVRVRAKVRVGLG